ncbi:cytochrome P450 [Nonomuraea sp. NBC_00507]|uniref:cytochrome P450 n=1 Tax=Nonomuraea sp. NBC_00507 TaxID=2976002 RepID=UPI002E1744B0
MADPPDRIAGGNPTHPLFDPVDPAFRADPYPVYAQMRRMGPIADSRSGMWLISRHRDVAFVLRDRRIGHNDPRDYGADRIIGPDGRPLVSFIGLNPPEHTHIRALVSKVFTPTWVERLRPSIQVLVDELLDGVLGNTEADLVSALARPLPVTIICELLGIPARDRDSFQAWADVLVRGLDVGSRPSRQELGAAGRAASSYFLDLAEERRRHPRGDLLSSLAAANSSDNADADVLTDAELVGTSVLLLNAGYETTVNLIGNGILTLLRHPDQLAHVRDNPQSMPAVIEELLRYDAPVQLVPRAALEDVEVGGKLIAAGDRMLVFIGAANRDPEVFANADRMDVARRNNPHLSFAAGIHFCLGAPLARLEAQLAIGTLLRRAPKLALVTEHPRFRQNFVLRGPEQLRVRLT